MIVVQPHVLMEHAQTQEPTAITVHVLLAGRAPTVTVSDYLCKKSKPSHPILAPPPIMGYNVTP